MELYEEILKDREAGARRLVAEYRERMMAAAMLLCHDAAEAEDLVFRAFEQAINKIGNFRPTGSFYYWVYTILLNFYRMDTRKRSVRPVALAREELPEVAAPVDNPFREFVFRGSAEAVRTAVQRLPENYREVVVLKYFEELSSAEIAKIVGVPEGTVRSRLHYAKDALYAMLSDTELSPDFADRLVRATNRRKGWLFRRSAVASLAILLALAAVAVGVKTVSLIASAEAAKPAEKPLASPLIGANAESGLWKMVGSGSTFSLDADEIDRSVEKGLKYIASKQNPDGSFQGGWGNSAAVPALAGMAFLSKGHLPGTEPYGQTILRALDFVLGCADLSDKAPFKGYMGKAGNGRMYAHSIATLFLSEMSGMVDRERQARINAVLPHAVKVILDAQNQQKRDPNHLGGWRYEPNSGDSDLSCSGWALMALRSARLNGAELPEDAIEKAVLYVKRTQRGDTGAFSYQGNGGQNGETLSGAAILSLELCGKHLDPASLKAAEFIRRTYKGALSGRGQVFYGLYYTAQGLFQIGGESWKEFEEWMYTVFLKRQQGDGSWNGPGGENSPVYATAMTTLAFTVPYRMLPIYQRDETVDGEENEEAPERGKEKRK